MIPREAYSDGSGGKESDRRSMSTVKAIDVGGERAEKREAEDGGGEGKQKKKKQEHGHVDGDGEGECAKEEEEEEEEEEGKDGDGDGGRMKTKKWEGAVEMEVGASVEEVWEVAGDFCGLEKWAGDVHRCDLVQGKAETPGCVRQCFVRRQEEEEEDEVSWVTEKLLSMDASSHSYSYALLHCSQSPQPRAPPISPFPFLRLLHLHNYVSTFRVSPSSSSSTSIVRWSFELDPIPHFPFHTTLISSICDCFARRIRSLDRSLLH